MRSQIRSRGTRAGGAVKGYPLDRLHEEIAFVTYHFHWGYDTVMHMEHGERRRWCEEISKINEKISGDSKNEMPLEAGIL